MLLILLPSSPFITLFSFRLPSTPSFLPLFIWIYLIVSRTAITKISFILKGFFCSFDHSSSLIFWQALLKTSLLGDSRRDESSWTKFKFNFVGKAPFRFFETQQFYESTVTRSQSTILINKPPRHEEKRASKVNSLDKTVSQDYNCVRRSLSVEISLPHSKSISSQRLWLYVSINIWLSASIKKPFSSGWRGRNLNDVPELVL